jgi:hypothetical protein
VFWVGWAQANEGKRECLEGPWPCLATIWQLSGNRLATIWQLSGNCLAKAERPFLRPRTVPAGLWTVWATASVNASESGLLRPAVRESRCQTFILLPFDPTLELGKIQ